jgi:putative transposase
MTYNPQIHHRRSIRLKGYDYTQKGAYYITIDVLDRTHLFGDIQNGKTVLSEAGKIVYEKWLWLFEEYNYIDYDEWVIMPNHFHGIIIIHDSPNNLNSIPDNFLIIPNDLCSGGSQTPPPTVNAQNNIDLRTAPKRKSFGRIVGVFKTMTTKHINILLNTPGKIIWQRDFYEHIIRNEDDLERIQKYIMNNPSKGKKYDEYLGNPE